MSRRIVCNNLSVVQKEDGSGGIVNCDVLNCKTVNCENTTPTEENNTPKTFSIPYTLPISHISLGLMGNNSEDCSQQTVYSVCDMSVKKLQITWHDWYPGYPQETIHLKVNENEWVSVVLKGTQTFVDFEHEIKDGNSVLTCVYAESNDDNEHSVQSLSIQMIGSHSITLN